jgi:hypothetical protein
MFQSLITSPNRPAPPSPFRLRRPSFRPERWGQAGGPAHTRAAVAARRGPLRTHLRELPGQGARLFHLHRRQHGRRFAFLHPIHDLQQHGHVEIVEDRRGVAGLHGLVSLYQSLPAGFLAVTPGRVQRLQPLLQRLQFVDACFQLMFRRRQHRLARGQRCIAAIQFLPSRAQLE